MINPHPVNPRSQTPRPVAKRVPLVVLWSQRSLALLVALNYGLVLFDLSYVPWRNFWLQGTLNLPGLKLQLPRVGNLTALYDPIKGIEPNRETDHYLRLVDQLQDQLEAQSENEPKNEPKPEKSKSETAAIQTTLQALQDASADMIESNPFGAVGKSGTLEKIKNRMRDRTSIPSAKLAFEQFWSTNSLTPQRQESELLFFDRQIRPLIETNYYRGIGENGQFVDRFWRIDRWFQLFFAFELLSRIYGIKRRHPSLGWREALLWRWYDLILLLPLCRWLRAVPLILRLQSSRLLNLEPVRSQVSRGFVGVFAGELIEVIAIQTINQIQTGVRRGDLKSLLNATQNPYVDLNDTNEIEVLARRLSEILVYQVLPKIQPDLEALLQQNLLHTLQRLPAYQVMQSLPGFNFVPNRLTQQLASGVSQVLTTVSQGTHDTLAVRDPTAADLTEQLVRHFTLALTEALSDQNTLQEIQTLICDFLEELKVNYVRRIADADFEGVLEEAQLLSRPPRR